MGERAEEWGCLRTGNEPLAVMNVLEKQFYFFTGSSPGSGTKVLWLPYQTLTERELFFSVLFSRTLTCASH